jgi:general secretion pathway protein G
MHIQTQKGFTVVELLVVIVVIGLLAAITIVSYTSIQQRSRDETRTSNIRDVQKALEKYRADNGMYPSVGSDNTGYALTALDTALVPKYLDSIPVNPSGSAYQYVRGAVANDSYGIRVDYETKTDCHAGINNTGVTWWSMQACLQQ